GSIIVHCIQRLMKTVDQYAPEFVALAKINGTIHGFHSSFLKPVFAKIKNKISGFLIVDTVEKTDSAGWLIVFIRWINKNGDFSYRLSGIIFEKKSLAFSSFKKFVFFSV